MPLLIIPKEGYNFLPLINIHEVCSSISRYLDELRLRDGIVF